MKSTHCYFCHNKLHDTGHEMECLNCTSIGDKFSICCISKYSKSIYLYFQNLNIWTEVNQNLITIYNKNFKVIFRFRCESDILELSPDALINKIQTYLNFL